MKSSLGVIFLLCGQLFSMDVGIFSPEMKRKRKGNNTAFINYLLNNGSFYKDQLSKPEQYYSQRALNEEIQIETIIYVLHIIQGTKKITTIANDTMNPSVRAYVRYSVSNNKCTIDIIQTEFQFQRKGYGSQLLQEVEEELKNVGCKEISLIAVDGTEEFYQKNGYTTSNVFGRMHKQLP